jgi:hypothetical protein
VSQAIVLLAFADALSRLKLIVASGCPTHLYAVNQLSELRRACVRNLRRI